MIDVIVTASIVSLFSSLAFFKPKWGLFLMVPLLVLMHKQYFSLFDVWDLLPARVALMSFLTGYFLSLLYFGRFRDFVKNSIKNPVIVLFALFLTAVALSFTNAIDVMESAQLFAFTASQFLFILAAFDIVKTKNNLVSLLYAYVVVGFFTLMFAIYQYWYFIEFGREVGAIWHIPQIYTRLGSIFWDVNHYGAYLVTLFFITFSLGLVLKDKLWRLTFFVVSVFTLAGLLATNSRSSWIGFAFAGLIYAILLFKAGFKKLVFALSLLFILGIGSLGAYIELGTEVSLGERYREYMHTRLDSSESHMMLLQKAWNVFGKYQLFGGGYANFSDQIRMLDASYLFERDPGAARVRVPVHSVWGQVLAETGLAGFLSYSALVLFIAGILLKISIERRDVLAIGLLSALSGILISGIFYSYNIEFFWWTIMFGAVYGGLTLKGDFKVMSLIKWVYARPWMSYLFVLGFSLIVLFLYAGNTALIDYDEAIYAKVAKNIAEGQGWLTLYWNTGAPWFEKPPLYMWLSSLTLSVMSYEASSWAVRVWSGLFGLGTVIIVYHFGHRLFGRLAAFLSAIVLVTTVHFLYYSRIGMLDVAVTFFITASLFVYYFYRERKLGLLGAGLLIGLAVMTKGVVGLLPVAVLGIYELFLTGSGRQGFLRSVRNGLIVFAGLSVTGLPWHVYMVYKHGEAFWNDYVVYHVIKRGTTSLEHKSGPLYWYLVVLKVSMRFWFIALIPSFIFLVLETLRGAFKSKVDEKYVFLLIWSLVIFVFFSVADSKLIWYIIPIYPVLALIVGWFGALCVNYFTKKVGVNGIVIRFLVVFTVVLAGFYNVYLIRDRVWTPDFNKEKKELIHTSNKHYSHKTLFYYEMSEPVIRFYSNADVRGVGGGNIISVYKSLPFSRSMLVLAPSEVEGIFKEEEISFIRIDKRDNLLLYRFESKREKFEREMYELEQEIIRREVRIQQKRTRGEFITEEEFIDVELLKPRLEEMRLEYEQLLREERESKKR